MYGVLEVVCVWWCGVRGGMCVCWRGMCMVVLEVVCVWCCGIRNGMCMVVWCGVKVYV